MRRRARATVFKLPQCFNPSVEILANVFPIYEQYVYSLNIYIHPYVFIHWKYILYICDINIYICVNMNKPKSCFILILDKIIINRSVKRFLLHYNWLSCIILKVPLNRDRLEFSSECHSVFILTSLSLPHLHCLRNLREHPSFLTCSKNHPNKYLKKVCLVSR